MPRNLTLPTSLLIKPPSSEEEPTELTVESDHTKHRTFFDTIYQYFFSPSHLEIVLSEQQAKTAEAPKTETKAQ